MAIILALPAVAKVGVLCVTDVLAPDDVTLVLVVKTVVLDVTEEVEELPLEGALLGVLAAVTAVDGVEVETAVVSCG